MTAPRPLPPPDEPPGQTLLGRTAGWRPTPRQMIGTVAILVPLLAAGLFQRSALRLEAEAARRPPVLAVRAATAPRLSLTATLAALDRALPPAARVATFAGADRLSAIIETTEPDRLRAALAAERMLAALRTTGEAALADGGYRVTLEERR